MCLWKCLTILPDVHLRSDNDQDSVQASHDLLDIHVFMDLAMCAAMLEEEGAIRKLFPQSWEHEIVQKCLSLKH